MHYNQHIFEKIKKLLLENHITQDDVKTLYNPLPSMNNKPEFSLIATIFYLIGGLTIASGVATLLGLSWFMLYPLVRVFIVMGSSLIAYTAGYMINNRYREFLLSNALFFVATILFYLGLGASFEYFNLPQNYSSISLLFSLMTIWSVILWWYFKRELFIPFIVLSATALIYVITGWISGDPLHYYGIMFHFYGIESMYRSLVIGPLLILFGAWISTYNKAFSAALSYALGLTIFLVSYNTIAPQITSVYWMNFAFLYILKPLLIAGIFFLSLYLKSNILYIGSSIYTICFFNDFFQKFFYYQRFESFYYVYDGLYYIIAGIIIVALGYLYYRIKERYFRDIVIYI